MILAEKKKLIFSLRKKNRSKFGNERKMFIIRHYYHHRHYNHHLHQETKKLNKKRLDHPSILIFFEFDKKLFS